MDGWVVVLECCLGTMSQCDARDEGGGSMVAMEEERVDRARKHIIRFRRRVKLVWFWSLHSARCPSPPCPLPCRCDGALNAEEPEAAWLAYKGCSFPPRSVWLHIVFSALFLSSRFLLCTSHASSSPQPPCLPASHPPRRICFTKPSIYPSLLRLLSAPRSLFLSPPRNASIINIHPWISPKTKPRFRPSSSAF